MKRISNYIDGQLCDPVGGKYLECFEPATGQVYAQVPDSDVEDVERAVAAAQTAFDSWSNMPATDRFRVMMKIADGIEQNLEPLALAESVDGGKPIKIARGFEIPRAATNFRFFASAILQQRSDAFSTDSIALNYTLRRPRGVAGLISPWNLPLYLLTWKIAPALATGNTVVAKPSELTPMTAYLFSEICQQAGLPPGVLNIVHGLGGKAGSAIVRHKAVPTISFTGGTKTGQQIAQDVAPMFKRLALEMGGKNPNIIFADCDLSEAVKTTVRSSFQNSGQVCLCGSRIFVEESLYGDFINEFINATKALRVGDPLEDSTDQGCVVSAAHLEKIRYYVDLAKQEGGKVLHGGQPPATLSDRCKNGYFFLPTILTGLGPQCRVNQEEIFGPVVTVMPFRTEEEVIEAANSTSYGLSASLWTGNVKRAHRIAEKLASGTVWVNCWLVRDLRVPFGGMKQSGVGREGGEEAMRFFTEPKTVCINVQG